MHYEPLARNPLSDYDDLKQALLDSIRPYGRFFTPGRAGIDLGPPGATFTERAVRLEGFARLLWGIVPLMAGGNEYEDFGKIHEGIVHGVDPHHDEYWGEPGDYDQRLVEMAVFGYALCLAPERFWTPLDESTRRRLAQWLSFINKRQIPNCNWVFFRILVNAGLEKAGAAGFDREQLSASLDMVEKFYLEDGWYNDGFPEERRARDYYIPWAMHYYGLIFAAGCGDRYPRQASLYRERAREFAAQFQSWFSPDGAALPLGRSLTYRYAQAAFWGALVLSDAGDTDWGLVKGLLLRNLRWWFGRPFFSETGLQGVGYAYPNQYMAERYNSPCSPLWALKAFVPLAVSPRHPFWTAEEKPLEQTGTLSVQPASGLVIIDENAAGHVHALATGQWTPGESNEHNHMAEKYAKFAYSCAFGFNVATDCYGLDKLGHDNMLMVAAEDRWFRFRTRSFDHAVTKDCLCSRWSPFDWLEIRTFIMFWGAWHLRLHHLHSEKPFVTAEGGFALAFDDTCRPAADSLKQTHAHAARYETAFDASAIVDLLAERSGSVVVAAPNANIMHPHTLIPTLSGAHGPAAVAGSSSKSHARKTNSLYEVWLGCAVLACPETARGRELARQAPDLKRTSDAREVLSRLPPDDRGPWKDYLETKHKGASR